MRSAGARGDAPLDTGPLDTGATDTAPDTTSSFTALIFTDATSSVIGDATVADEAVTANGGTATLGDATTFNGLFDAKTYNVIVVDSAYNYLPTGMDTRLATFVGAGGRVVFAYWALESTPTLLTAFEVKTVTFSTPLDVYRDPTSLVDLFAGTKERVPSPFTGGSDSLSDDGDQLTTTGTGGFLAARFSSSSGTGAIAVTRGGKVIVNGFMPFEFMTNDADADGKPDVQELLQNEIAYVLSK